jgi:hypothetical protein
MSAQKENEQSSLPQDTQDKKPWWQHSGSIILVVFAAGLVFVSCIALIIIVLKSEFSYDASMAPSGSGRLPMGGLWRTSWESILFTVGVVFGAMLFSSIPLSFFMSLFSGGRRARIKGDLWAEIEPLGFDKFLLQSTTFATLMKGEDAKKPSKTQIAKAFNDRFDDLYGAGTYAFPIAWLTAFYFLGWLVFFLPTALTGGEWVKIRGDDFVGFAALIQDGIVPYLQAIADKGSLFSYAFLGSYFWSLQVLVRRYRNSDLKPKTFVTATQRVLSGIVAAFVFSVAMPDAWAESPAGRAAFGFFLGMFTMPIVGALWERTRNLIGGKEKVWTRLWPQNDLDQLGIDPFAKQRLAEENVASIHDLATVNLLDLLTHTRIDTQRIISWVDQALLHHCAGEELAKGLEIMRILKASDLLDVWNNVDSKNENLLTRTELLNALAKLLPDEREKEGLTKVRIKGLVTNLKRESNINYVYGYWQNAEA